MLRDFLAVFFGVGTWADSRDRKKKEGEKQSDQDAAPAPGSASSEPPTLTKGVDFRAKPESDS